MKMKKIKKKLSLQMETIANLSLTHVRGGDPTTVATGKPTDGTIGTGGTGGTGTASVNCASTPHTQCWCGQTYKCPTIDIYFYPDCQNEG